MPEQGGAHQAGHARTCPESLTRLDSVLQVAGVIMFIRAACTYKHACVRKKRVLSSGQSFTRRHFLSHSYAYLSGLVLAPHLIVPCACAAQGIVRTGSTSRLVMLRVCSQPQNQPSWTAHALEAGQAVRAAKSGASLRAAGSPLARLELVGQPVQALEQALALDRARLEYGPVPVLDRVQVEALRHRRIVQRARQVLQIQVPYTV